MVDRDKVNSINDPVEGEPINYKEKNIYKEVANVAIFIGMIFAYAMDNIFKLVYSLTDTVNHINFMVQAIYFRIM